MKRRIRRTTKSKEECEVAKVDEVIALNGVVIHSQRDWPCSGCRPVLNEEQGSTFLCVRCAIFLTETSVRRIATRHDSGSGDCLRESEIEEGSGTSGWVPPALWESR